MDCMHVATRRGLIDAFLELKHRSFHLLPGDGVPLIHRFCDRGHDVCTPTYTSIVPKAGGTSAYPADYRRTFASYPILRSTGLQPDRLLRLRGPESTVEVIPFQVVVLRGFRTVLCTGFNGSEPWSGLELPGP